MAKQIEMGQRKNIAVILAGGVGLRMGDTLPKQLLKIAGKKVIEHTIQVFENNPLIDEIAIVINANYHKDIENIIITNEFSKVKKILMGGQERSDSSKAAIKSYEGIDCNLIFHDSVRPLISHRIIKDCIKALDTYNAVDVAIPTTDTIIETDTNDIILHVPDRSKLRNGQTPQAFRLKTIKKAYELADQDPNFKTTDDCGVVLKYLPKEPIYVVKGELSNMKLTYKEDLFLLDKLYQLSTQTGIKEQVTEDAKKNLKGKVIVVWGGSSGIGESLVSIASKYQAHVYSFSRRNGYNINRTESIEQALKEVHSKHNRIDCVINCTGVLIKQPLVSMRDEDILDVINTNYTSSALLAKRAFPYLKETKGTLIFFTSSSYTRGRSFYSLYSSSKAAIVNLTQALSEEWANFGIRVNCINPERTNTPMRVSNFGIEPKETLLESEDVANTTINSLFSLYSGVIIDVKRD